MFPTVESPAAPVHLQRNAELRQVVPHSVHCSRCVNSGHEAIVRLLIEGGADVNYRIPGERPLGKNPKTAGLTPLRVAEAKNQSGIVELLKKAGANR